MLSSKLKICVLTLFIAPALTSAVAADNSSCETAVSGEPLVKIDKSTYAFKGLTKLGQEVFRKNRDIIRDSTTLFRGEFRNLDSMHHAGDVARLSKSHMFLYGPFGAAKTGYVKWRLKREAEPVFSLQLDQTIQQTAFVGGQDFEEAKKGRFVVNTKGSLADYQVASLDEWDKGNPGALAALLRLLNEREVAMGGKVTPARLETMYGTSNANLPEIEQQFRENGQGSTFGAMMNRFQIKGLFYNWLKVEDQAVLDQRRQKQRYLQSLAVRHPEVKKDEVFLEPQPVDWAALRHLAHAMFDLSPLFMTKYREFVNDMRDQTNRAIKESEINNKQHSEDEPFVYVPSADYSERLRQQIPELVLMSAFLDFLHSPLADDGSFEENTKTPIVMDPLSLWRAYLVMTTIGPGEAQLKLDKDNQQKLDIDFDWAIDPSASSRDKREERLIKNLKAEQDRFERTFFKHMEDIKTNIELLSRHSARGVNREELENADFELKILRHRQE